MLLVMSCAQASRAAEYWGDQKLGYTDIESRRATPEVLSGKPARVETSAVLELIGHKPSVSPGLNRRSST